MKPYAYIVMWKLFLISLSLLVSVLNSYATSYNDGEYEYTLSSVGRGVNGSLLIRIKCVVATPNEAVSYASKCAVHGLVFKGAKSENNSPDETPLVEDKELSAKEVKWFDNMFQSDAYSQYIVSVSQSNMKIVKIKKRYSVDVTIAVNKSKLRKALESEGIIKRLGSVFENK